MAFVLKVAHGSDMRRKRFASSSDVTYKEIDSFVRDAFHLNDYVAKYVDDEGDLCLLEEVTLPDALELSVAKQLLRLEISQRGDIFSRQVGSQVAESDTCSTACDTVITPFDTRSVTVPPGFSSSGCDGDFAVVDPTYELNPMGFNTYGFGNGYACDPASLQSWGASAASSMGKGWGGHGKNKWGAEGGCGGGGGPNRIVVVMKSMRQSGCLNTEAVSALILQWLPMITQRAIRKMDKLTKVGPGVVGKIGSAIAALAKSVEDVPDLRHFHPRLDALARDPASTEVGLLVVELLKALGEVDLSARRRVISAFVEAVFTRLDDLLDSFEVGWSGAAAPELFVHWGITCDGCNTTPLQGLRFKCAVCDNYDLCAKCFMKKEEFHDGNHEFTNMLDHVKGHGHGCKGKGKGWKGCKGWKGGWW